MMFKKFPSCGATQGLTELTLQLVQDLALTPDQVQLVEVRQPPYSHKLVGHPFKLGPNPRVDAQFSVPYCVANAIVRGSSRLEHFRPEQIRDPAVLALAAKVRGVADAAMDVRGHTAVDVILTTTDGQRHHRQLDTAPGYPGNPLSETQQLGRFHDCMAYAARPLPAGQVQAFLDAVQALSSLADARVLLKALTLR
jgi:2-methylcitrate dehydratase PrpD